MTRHTATTRISKSRLVLEVEIYRDETSGYRHQWTTTARFGLLTAQGPNTREAADSTQTVKLLTTPPSKDCHDNLHQLWPRAARRACP